MKTATAPSPASETFPLDESAQKNNSRLINIFAWAAAAAFSLYLVVRLFRLIDRYAVNLLFYDNFTYYFYLAGHGNFWQRFTAQVGPHREGVGLLLSSIVAPLSGWNMRAEAFVIGSILVAALLVFLWMKKRATQQVTWYDLIILSCFFLTPQQWEIWSNTINSSHGAIPLLLVVLWCLGWTIQNPRVRVGFILVVNFAAIFTGFGLFLGIVTPIVFAFAKNKRGLRVSLLSLVLFMWNYHFDAANPGFQVLDPAILRLPYAIAVGLSHVCDIVVSPWDEIAGYVLLALLLAALVWQFRGFRKGEVQSVINVSLIAFSFLFAAAATEGRISIGDKFLTWSRYTPLLLPGFLGGYLSVQRLQSRSLKTVFTVIALGLALQTSLFVSAQNLHMMQKFKSIKMGWINSYVASGDLDKANHMGELPIYPGDPPIADFQARLDYLRDHRLNFWSDQAQPAGESRMVLTQTDR